ncbi:hypothetical protein NDU88_004322 [Pleurodeles waltl]|uniref:Uncharacterized protein n=1 Tax=Pleurodeles waltl TaxID=8319 RepID=A0AAV7NP03_PLEWA|nr:hypothetical protein NDU88_004322 [Pleurodeles waltl]
MSVTGRTVRLIPFPVSISLQVTAHQKKGIWRAIAKDVQTLWVYGSRSTYCWKRWVDLRRCARKTAEAQQGMASQRGRGAHPTLTPLLAWKLAVAYAELDGCLVASQQPQGDEYSAPIYNLHVVGWYPGGGCGPVGAPRPGLTLQSRSHVGQGSDVKVLQPS